MISAINAMSPFRPRYPIVFECFCIKKFNSSSKIHFSNLFSLVPTCKSRGDFLFLVDASASVKNNFKSELYFVKRFAQSLNESSRAGVILFGDSAVNSIKIEDYSSARGFTDLVRRLQPIGSITRIDKGLITTHFI